MLRGFRHTLFLLLQLGIVISGAGAVALYPDSWPSVLICVAGSVIASLICERIASKYLGRTLGRLRRLTDQLGHGRPVQPLETQPGDDFYKLISAINLVSTRLDEATVEEKRLNEKLRRTEKLAVLGELAANVAHEVNNPLDGIQNCLRIARRSLDDQERVRQMLDLMDSGLERIELIVRRLLTLARQQVIRPQRADLRSVIDSTVKMAADDFERRGLRISVSGDGRAALAHVDPPLLEQAFLNLMNNAADSMSEGGELSISVKRVAAEPGAPIQIDFCDDGAGIDAEDLPHIFEPFFTTKGGEKGTGLGLSIAARIIDAHHGSIGVAAREPRGAVFTIRIPSLPGGQPSTSRGDDAVAELAAAPTEPTR